MKSNNFGFTITELILVMAIAMILMAIGAMAFIRPQQKTNFDGVLNTLIADIKSEQTRAMSGDLISDYGLHLEENKYTLFKGSSYNSSDPDNYVVLLEDPLKLTTITFANQNIIFQKGSGEVNFLTGQNSFFVTNSAGEEQVKITINKYGAIQEE